MIYCTWILMCSYPMLSYTQNTTAYKAPETLTDYMEWAAKNNVSLMSEFKMYEASLQRIDQAGAYPDPQLDLGVFLSPMSQLNGKQIADIKLMQMFPWFGVSAAAQSEATHRSQMAFEKFQASRNMLYLNIAQQWYEMCSLKQHVKNTEANRELLKHVESLALNKYSTSSQSNMSDVLRIQMEEAQWDNELESLQSQMKSKQAQFNNLLNRPLNSSIEVPDTLIYVPYVYPEDSSAYPLFLNNPEVKMVEEEVLAYQFQGEMLRKKSYPMFGIGVDYMLMQQTAHPQMSTMNGKDMIMPMVTTTIPIFRKKYKAQQKESALMKQGSEEKYTSQINQLQANYVQVLEEMKDSERKITLYQKQYNLAQSTFTLMVQEFSTGKTGLNDLLQVNKQLIDYQLKESDAVAQYAIQCAKLKWMINKQ